MDVPGLVNYIHRRDGLVGERRLKAVDPIEIHYLMVNIGQDQVGRPGGLSRFHGARLILEGNGDELRAAGFKFVS
jgi:hypothetical protein